MNNLPISGSRTFAARFLAIAMTSLILPACFGFSKVQVVPASAGPQPPPGTAWSCVDFSRLGGDQHTPNTTSSTCYRSEDECRTHADANRKDPRMEVGFCHAEAKAWCSAMWTDATKAQFHCGQSLHDCGPVGGIGGAPGMKQSECAEY
jgi:hypothetical protein